MVDRQAPVAAAVLLHQIGDLGGPEPGTIARFVAGAEVVPRGAQADLVDGLQVLGQMARGAVLEQHHRPLQRHEQVAFRIVHRPHRHVAAAGRIADVDGPADQRRRVVTLAQLLTHAVQPICTHAPDIGLCDRIIQRHSGRAFRLRYGNTGCRLRIHRCRGGWRGTLPHSCTSQSVVDLLAARCRSTSAYLASRESIMYGPPSAKSKRATAVRTDTPLAETDEGALLAVMRGIYREPRGVTQ